MKAAIIDPSADAWPRFLESVTHDFYQLPAYAEVSATQDRGEAAALYVEDGPRQLLVPLVLRAIDGTDDVDATSPYGYPGILTTATDDPGFEGHALRAGLDVLRERGVVTLFIRLHPLLDSEPADDVGTLVCHGNTVTVDLSLPAGTLWSQTRRNHRQQIRQAQKAGYSAHDDPDWSRFEDFTRLYQATMEQRSASSYYFFDDDYFDGLRAALGDSVHTAFVALDGTVVASAIFVETDGIVQMHLTGHDVEHSRYQPMKLLFDHIRTWSQERGNRWLHLGGGRGGTDDSLYHFKAGFSPLRLPFYTRRVVVQPERYDALVAACDEGLDPTNAEGHFPLYRG